MSTGAFVDFVVGKLKLTKIFSPEYLTLIWIHSDRQRLLH